MYYGFYNISSELEIITRYDYIDKIGFVTDKSEAEEFLDWCKKHGRADDFAELIEVTSETPIKMPESCYPEKGKELRAYLKWVREYFDGYVDDNCEIQYSPDLHNILIAKGWKCTEELNKVAEEFGCVGIINTYTHPNHPNIQIVRF